MTERKYPTVKEMLDQKHQMAKDNNYGLGPVRLVECQLYSVYFKGLEWSIRSHGLKDGKYVQLPLGEVSLFAGSRYHHRISVIANSIDEAVARLHAYANHGGPSLDGVKKPLYEEVSVESITKKTRHWIPIKPLVTESGLVAPWNGVAYHGMYSFQSNEDSGWRDNARVSVVAESFEAAKKIIEDYTQQEEGAVIHSINYDGSVFVTDPSLSS